MTQIKLRTSDQHLIAAQKVKIAKGDINSVLLHVEFDSHWGEFTERKALFRNDAVNGNEAQDILMIGDECIVPPEVLSKSGTLEISVTGYTPDGKTKKTSTIVNLKVLESLKDASTTVAPSMDLYMQYLSTIQAEINPISEKINASIEATLSAKIAEMTAVVEEQRQWMQGTVLWENPDPTADMETLTIPLDRTQYPRLHIEVHMEAPGSTADVEEYWNECVCVHSNGCYPCTKPNAANASYRTITVSDDGIFIGSCDSTNSSIPFRIIGYKY